MSSKVTKKARHSSPSKSSDHGSDSSRDDTIGNYTGEPGDMIDGNYEIVRNLGQGTFGRVVLCKDSDGEMLAIKIIRKLPKYVKEAKIEASIIDAFVPMERIVHLYRHFEWNDHYCLVFEALGMSLYDYQKNVLRLDGMPLDDILHISKDIFEALEHLHTKCNVVHTDLKLENILFDLSQNEDAISHVKLIDFGGASHVKDPNEMFFDVVSTRQYRSPEVLLDLGWTYSTDIWSVGCILAELYLGKLLFETHEDIEHLTLIERITGERLAWLNLENCPDKLVDKYFDSHYRVRWPLPRHSRSKVRYIESTPTLDKLLDKFQDTTHRQFHYIVNKCLAVDAQYRWTASNAVQFLKSYFQSIDQYNKSN